MLWTPANLLTLSRLPMAAALWIWPRQPWWVLGVMVVSAATDVLDGRLARAQYARADAAPTEAPDIERAKQLGAWLDPLCDKLFVLSVLAVLLFVRRPEWWILLLVAAREVILVPAYVAYRIIRLLNNRLRFDFRAGIPGKIATVLQFLTIAVGVANHPALTPLAVLTGVAGVVAAAHYLARGAHAARLARE